MDAKLDDKATSSKSQRRAQADYGWQRLSMTQVCDFLMDAYTRDIMGASDCVECPVGSYDDLEGQSECTSCGSNRTSPERWTTFKQASNRWVEAWGRQESSPVTAKRFPVVGG